MRAIGTSFDIWDESFRRRGEILDREESGAVRMLTSTPCPVHGRRARGRCAGERARGMGMTARSRRATWAAASLATVCQSSGCASEQLGRLW